MHIEFDLTNEEPIEDKRQRGYNCPCCGLYVKSYVRKLNSSMAAVLLLLHFNRQYGFLHLENWLEGIGKQKLRADYHKLVWWGLLEKKEGKRKDDSTRNGFYKITGRGIAFASGEFTVKEKVKIFNNRMEGFEGKNVTIKECLGEKFSYAELMLA